MENKRLVNGEIVLKEEERKGYKIPCVEGAEVEKISRGHEGEIKYSCVINKSLLRDYCEEIGINISKTNTTKDIIAVKFNYAYRSDELQNILDEKKSIEIKFNEREKAEKSIKRLEKEIKKAKRDSTKEKKRALIDEQNEIINQYDYNELFDRYMDLNKQIKENEIKKQQLRIKLYKEGFSIPYYKTEKKEKVFDKEIKYKFFYRNAGKAKKGEDLFINEELLDSVKSWQMMGIELPKDEEIDLVGIETYKSLTSSAIEGYITFKPNEILIVKDLDCYSELQDIIKVYRDEVTGYSCAKHTKDRCKNTIWDGMALIQGGEGFRGLRHHMFKAGAFCSDFQAYFKDYYKDEYENATIKDMFSRELKVSEIRMITTNNAIKWIKFLGASKEAIEHWFKWIGLNGYKFGVCKRDHKSKYGNLQRMSYQMINSLPLTQDELKEVFKITKDYVDKMNNDSGAKFLLNVLDRKKSVMNINEMLVELSKHNVGFVNSYLFRDYQKEQIREFKNDLRIGKILVKGDNLTLVGNPFLLLKYVTGQLDEYIKDGVISDYIDESLPSKNSCYARIFEHNKELGAFRSPHNSPNNVMLFKNDYDEEIMNKYFSNVGDNVIIVNFLYNDIQDRGNGLDTDLDFAFTTDNEIIVESCVKCQEYPTIVNCFEKSDKGYLNTLENLANIDNLLQENQKATGTSSNVAQLLLSEAWDYDNKDYKNVLLDNVAILSVLAQVAIDSAKRVFVVGKDENGLNKEIERIRKQISCGLKPTFWQYTSKAFKNKEIEKKLKVIDKEIWKILSDTEKKLEVKNEKNRMIKELYDFECPMNWILKETDTIEEKKKANRVTDSKFLVEQKSLDKTTRRKAERQCKAIEELIEEFDYVCKFINISEDMEDEEVQLYYNTLYNEYIEKISKKKLCSEAMYMLIRRALDNNNKSSKSNSHIKTKLLNILFRIDKDEFLKCFKESK